MKIAVWHNLPSGGGKRALYYHVRGLVKRGHTVEVWCPPIADEAFLPLESLCKINIVPLQTDRQPNQLTHKIHSYRHMLERLKAMEQHCRECAGQIKEGKFDILFANACWYFRVTPIAHYVEIPSILYLQEPYRWLYEALPDLPWTAMPKPSTGYWNLRFIRAFLRNLWKVQALRVQAREEQLNAAAFDTILVNSFFSRESILRAYGLDAKVCYLGVDNEHFVNQHCPREGFLVGVGAFVPEKNIDFIIEALAMVPEPRPDLVWIGNVADRPYLAKLRAIAKSGGVQFHPKTRISDQELLNILNRATMMVYAPRLEPFGFAPLEGNACGLPVVAIAEGGVRETVVDGVNGLLVEHDRTSLAQAIERLIKEPGYAQQLGQNGEKLVNERWSLERAIDRLESSFEAVLCAS